MVYVEKSKLLSCFIFCLLDPSLKIWGQELKDFNKANNITFPLLVAVNYEDFSVKLHLATLLNFNYYKFKWRSKNFTNFVISKYKSVDIKVLYGTEYFFDVSYKNNVDEWIVVGKNHSIFSPNGEHCKIVVRKGRRVVPESIDVILNVEKEVEEHWVDGFIYSWNFGDETRIVKTSKSYIVHSYPKDGLFKIFVLISTDVFEKLYNCSMSVNTGNLLSSHMDVWQNENKSYPRLPSFDESFVPGIVRGHVFLNDPKRMFVGAQFKFEVRCYNRSQAGKILTIGKFDCEYKLIGQYEAVVDVYATVNNTVFFDRQLRRVSVHQPIYGLRIVSEKDVIIGESAPFTASCYGSKPVSFCWYITTSPCSLPSDVICSPTLINDKCQVEFHYTFNKIGDYCVNVSAVNTVGFDNAVHFVRVLEKSTFYAIGILMSVIAMIFLTALVVFYMKRRSRKKKHRRHTEEATFDFRQSTFQLYDNSVSTLRQTCEKLTYPLRRCAKTCFKGHFNDLDSDDEESILFRSDLDRSSSFSKKRKISYYGTVHMTLLQKKQPIVETDEVKENRTTFRHSISHSM